MAKPAVTNAPRVRKRRGEPVVQAVFAITLEQLAARGFERLSLPDIAEAAGLNKTSLYRRWPTKGELVRDALTASMTPPHDVPDTGDLRSDLLAMTRTAVAFVESPQGMAVHRMLLAESANPEVRMLAATIFRQKEGRGARLILKRAIRRGELPRDVDTRLILTTIAGALLHRTFVEHQPVTGRFLEGLVDLILSGVRRRA